MKQSLIIICILLIAAILRFYDLNWDQGYHLHPDERMITMVADKIHWPQTPTEIANTFSPESSLNPKFFAYGNFPVYFLKLAGTLAANFDPLFGSYAKLNLVGRGLSALFDLGTLFVLYLLAKKLFNRSIALLSALFYSIAVLPVQLSHFYAVDTLLTFFITLVLYLLLVFLPTYSKLAIAFLGTTFGFALATKISSVVLLVPIGIFHISALLSRQTTPLIARVLQIIPMLVLTIFTTVAVFFLLQPFTLIDFPTFKGQVEEQQIMTQDASVFPYTLQYINKIPYFYELKNIFFWGLGPVLALLSFLGTTLFTYRTFTPSLNTKYLVLTAFFWVYFFVVGSFAVGFMRYMLPLYPLLCLFAAIFLYQFFMNFKLRVSSHKILFIIITSLFFTILFIWPLSFISIYTKPNNRILASNWIYRNIPSDSIIAREHWDDGLPLEAKSYQLLELPLYDFDNSPDKWLRINQTLKESNYLIIASNRLYTPLQKLTDCTSLPAGRCYTYTADYYHKLFNNQLGFFKVAEFSILPTIPLLNIQINDSSADESFTVYDHPKIMIFKKS